VYPPRLRSLLRAPKERLCFEVILVPPPDPLQN
jgi:hypothetical protein